MKSAELSASVSEFLKHRLVPNQHRVFLFGSALRQSSFRDVDIGVVGTVDPKQLALLREDFEVSNFPYVVDVVDFNHVNTKFKDKVFQDKVLWLNF